MGAWPDVEVRGCCSSDLAPAPMMHAIWGIWMEEIGRRRNTHGTNQLTLTFSPERLPSRYAACWPSCSWSRRGAWMHLPGSSPAALTACQLGEAGGWILLKPCRDLHHWSPLKPSCFGRLPAGGSWRSGCRWAPLRFTPSEIAKTGSLVVSNIEARGRSRGI